MRSVREWVFEGLRRSGYPLIMTDDYGVRFVLYPWNKTPTWKLRGRQGMAKEFAPFTKLIPEGGIALDIGANIGIMAIMMSRRAKIVYAFEPTEETYCHLIENAGLNHTSNIVPIMKAVSSKDGLAKFHLFDPSLYEWNSLYYRETPAVRPQTTRQVPTITLDTFAREQKLGRIDFVKIDVEGAERDVFLGASKLLAEKRIAALSFEVWGEGLGAPDSADDKIGMLESLGYHTCRYDAQADAFQPLARPYVSPLNNDNLYAFPN